MQFRHFGVLILGLSIFCLGSEAIAQNLDKEVLTVTGKISGNEPVGLSLRDLQELPLHEFATTTPWHDGKVTFSGVLLSDLMNHLGAIGTSAELIALNQFRATLPLSDFTEFQTLLAYKKDGEFMAVRDKGPLFVIYPFDDRPELKTEVYFSRSVWSTRTIDVK